MSYFTNTIYPNLTRVTLTVIVICACSTSNASWPLNGGRLRFYNDSDKNISMTFSGLGCIGEHAYLPFVCKFEKNLPPGSEVSYQYPWGVSLTWINVQSAYHDGWAENLDWGGYMSPCVRIDSAKQYCYLNHHTLHLHSDRWTDFHFSSTTASPDTMLFQIKK